ncbi:MAG: hypothetical protein ACK4UJ_00590 [Leptonema sp. (in: bacteria)]
MEKSIFFNLIKIPKGSKYYEKILFKGYKRLETKLMVPIEKFFERKDAIQALLHSIELNKKTFIK